MADAKLDSHTAARVFTRAVGVAARAPSINNSQPWWWRLAGEVCELRAQRDRQLATTDPEGRLLCLSCGTVLHHTRMALAAEGWCFDVERLPERDKPDLLARLRLTGQTAPDATAVRLSHAAPLRYTDRRPLTMQRVDDEATAAVAAAAEAEGARLYLLRRDQVRELGAITRSALEIERANKAWIEEVGYWTGDRCPVSTGISPGTIPESPDQAIVPNRDFGRPGRLPVSPEDDRAATFAVLYGATDEPSAWLPAGEALSAAWLTATDLAVAMVPMGLPVEIAPTREALRELISGAGCPYLVLRLGMANTKQPEPERTPRLPSDAIISKPPA